MPFGFGFSKPGAVKKGPGKKAKKPSASRLFTTNNDNSVVWPFEKRDQAEGEENNEEGLVSGGSLGGLNGAAALNSHRDFERKFHGTTVIPLKEGASLKDEDDPDSPDEVEEEEPGKGYGPPPTLQDGLNVLRPDLVGKRRAPTTAIERQTEQAKEGIALPAPSHKKTFKAGDTWNALGISKTPPSSKTKQPAFSKKKMKSDEDSLEAEAVKTLLQEVGVEEAQPPSPEHKPEIVAALLPDKKRDQAYQRIKNISKRMIELDADTLDDDTSFQQYGRTAISGFGEAMLRGMGWKEGKGIGKTNKRLVKPYIARMRGRRQGLGAEKVVKKFNRKRPRKPGEKPREEEVSAKKKAKRSPRPDDHKDDPPSPKLAPRKIKKKPLKWVQEGLRVRIVTKDFGKKYYKQKAIVLAIKNTYYFPVRAEESRKTLQGVVEKDVETALPKTGGLVVILRGEHKGQRGTLMRKNKKKQTADVQLLEDLTIVNMDYDDICQSVRGA